MIHAIADIAVLLAMMLVSIIVHETGHMLMAKAVGWQIKGFHFSWRGIFARMSSSEFPRTNSLRLVAAAGPVASLIFAAMGATLPVQSDHAAALIQTMVFLNLIFFAVNILPLGKYSDGWVIITGRVQSAKR